MRPRIITLALTGMITLSCSSSHDKPDHRRLPGKNEMAELNKYLVRKDKERIESYIERKGLRMKEDSSGLWYLIISEGTGKFLTDGDKMKIDYDCTLLDGTKCYSSDELGPKEIVLGKTGIEPGL